MDSWWSVQSESSLRLANLLVLISRFLTMRELETLSPSTRCSALVMGCEHEAPLSCRHIYSEDKPTSSTEGNQSCSISTKPAAMRALLLALVLATDLVGRNRRRRFRRMFPSHGDILAESAMRVPPSAGLACPLAALNRPAAPGSRPGQRWRVPSCVRRRRRDRRHRVAVPIAAVRRENGWASAVPVRGSGGSGGCS